MKCENKPIRILHCVNDLHRAGLETLIMNYYINIDKKKIQFDFLTHRPYKSDYDEEIEQMGGKVYYAPRLYPHNYFKYFRWMNRFFKEHQDYFIIHSHIDSMSFFPLLAAKINHIPVRIAHSHSTSIDKDFKYPLKQILRKKINKVCNVRLSCGLQAGQYLFGNKEFDIIPNAVDAQKFYYNKLNRITKRKELKIDDKFVIGHVGRFSYPKNHKFLIDIFREIKKIESKSVLLLVGTGEKEEEIRRYVEKLNLIDSVLFLGNKKDVNAYYSAMDVFVMPSLFEGIPLAGIEAQFSNMNCYFSDRIPKEVQFSKKVKFISLNNSSIEWANKIIKGRNTNREKTKFLNYNYDIKYAHKKLEEYYFKLYKRIIEEENNE